ncbi:MAG TPA: hypothetical protein VJU58_13870 [Microbacterium sp.]|nr:hypothetical protein [Microbacterium sp.]
MTITLRTGTIEIYQERFNARLTLQDGDLRYERAWAEGWTEIRFEERRLIRWTPLDADARREIADRIAAALGCDIQPGAIAVLGYWSQGWPKDDERIAHCRQVLRDAGVAPWEGAPLGSVRTPQPIEIKPVPQTFAVPLPTRKVRP